MAATPTSIRFHNAQSGTQTFPVQASGTNQFQVAAQTRIELVAGTAGAGKLQASRKGHDLIMQAREGDGPATEIVLKDYYAHDGSELLGLDGQGHFVDYVPTDTAATHSLDMLADGASSGLTLDGSTPDLAAPVYAASDAQGLSPWVVGAAALGAIALASSGKSSGAQPQAVPAAPAAPTTAAGSYIDNAGPVTSTASHDTVTDDRTPSLNTGPRPSGVTGAVLYVDGVLTAATYNAADGTLTPDAPLSRGTHHLSYGWQNAAGTSAPGPSRVLTIDADAPAAATGIQIADVNGSGQPRISGNGEPGATVTVTDPSGGTHTAMADASGHFDVGLPVPASLTGAYGVQLTDPVGNTSETVVFEARDLSAPDAPTLRVTHAAGDAGLHISGSGEPGSTIRITDPGGATHSAIADASGHYDLDIATPSPDGLGSYAATATDQAGNTSLPATAHVTDLTPPAASSVPDLDAADDTGVSSTDNTTAKTTGLTFTGTAEEGSTVTLFNDANGNGRIDAGENLGTANAAGGRWSLDAALPDAATPYLIKASVTDMDGNRGLASAGLSVRIDGSGATLPGGGADPLAANTIAVTAISTDTGVSTSDFITSDRTLVFSGTSNAADGANVEVLLNNAHIGYTTVRAGVWSYDYSGTTLSPGTYSLRANLVDVAGSMAKSSSVQTVVVDISGATLPGGGADPLAANAIAVTAITTDTGVNTSDFITSDRTLVFSGTSNAADGANVEVLLNNVHIGYTTVRAGMWSYDYSGTTLSPGTYSLRADLIDVAGSTAKSSSVQTVIVDISGATLPGGGADPLAANAIAVTAISTDTGVSTSDFITSDRTLAFGGTSNAADGSNVDVLLNNAHIGYTTVHAGVWSYDYSGTTLNAGSYSLRADLVDVAGSTAKSSSVQTVVVDTSGATLPGGGADPLAANAIAITTISTDTGVSTSDFTTSDRTLVFSGTSNAADGANVDVLLNNVHIGYTTVRSGVWSYDYSGTTLNAGTYSLRADLIDVAGSVAKSSSVQTVVVDTSGATLPGGGTDPLAANAIAVTGISTDTGVSASDFITSDRTLDFSGTSNAADGANVEVLLNNAHIGYTTVRAGVWSYDYSGTALNAGTYSLRADLVDVAGSTAKSSSVQTVVVDTSGATLPGGGADPLAANAIAVTAISTDTGVSANDFITSDRTLVFSGTSNAADGSNVDVLLNNAHIGYTTVRAGMWSYDYSGTTLNAGSYSLRADLVDVAGSVAKSSSVQTVVVDTSGAMLPGGGADPLAANAIAVTAISTDTGVSASDFITSDRTLVFSGTSNAADDSNVDVLLNNAHIGYTTVHAGVWSYDYSGTALNAGTYGISANLVDTAGNAAAASAIQTVLIDTTPPATPQAAPDLVAGFDSGSSDSDNVTNVNRPALLLPALNAGETLRLYVDDVETAGVFNPATHTFTPDAALSDGAHTIKTTLTDTAGNVSAFSPSLSLVIDTLAPVFTIRGGSYSPPATPFGPGTDFVGRAYTTNEPVTYSVGGPDAAMFYIGSDGILRNAYTIEPGHPQYNFQVIATDLAGNVTRFSPGTLPVVLDLNRDGVMAYGKSLIDVDGDGIKDLTSWVAPEDGVLVWDKYHDGQVHDSSQYAFAQYAVQARTDLEGLRVFDTSGNGALDSLDALWKEMAVWQDANGNGISDTGEVRTLSQLGIRSISLLSDGTVTHPAEGVTEMGRTTATLDNGSRMDVADVAFSYVPVTPADAARMHAADLPHGVL